MANEKEKDSKAHLSLYRVSAAKIAYSTGCVCRIGPVCQLTAGTKEAAKMDFLRKHLGQLEDDEDGYWTVGVIRLNLGLPSDTA